MKTIFIKTRWHYDSYTDFWRLVELSGYPTVYVDEVKLDNPDERYVLSPMNGEWRPHIDNLGRQNIKSDVYLWNLERPDSFSVNNYKPENYYADNKGLINDGYVKNIIVSDRALALRTGFKYIPMGIHEGLGEPGAPYSKCYDTIHLMCPSHNRSEWFEGNAAPKVLHKGISIAPNGWGMARAHNLHASRFMLNVHQDFSKYIEPLRMTLAAAYGLMIVSQDSYDFYPYDTCGGVIVSDMSMRSLNNICADTTLYYRGLHFREAMLDSYKFSECLEVGL